MGCWNRSGLQRRQGLSRRRSRRARGQADGKGGGSPREVSESSPDSDNPGGCRFHDEKTRRFVQVASTTPRTDPAASKKSGRNQFS